MKIKSVKFKNASQEWSYEKIDFFDLTLLVGVSGAGKTQILRSIMTIRDVAKGEPKNGVEWEIEFGSGDHNYFWLGKFETRGLI